MSNDDASEIHGQGLGSFTMIPDFIVKIGLTPDALALYTHYKSFVHEDTKRACFKSTATLCKEVRMSDDRIRKAKRELQAFNLIAIRKTRRNDGGRGPDHITVLDVWRRNHTPTPKIRFKPVAKTENSVYPPPENDTRISSAFNQEGKSMPPLLQSLEETFAINLNGKGNWLVQSLAKYNAQPAQVAVFKSWWDRNDWRGRKGEVPTPQLISELWPQAFRPKRAPQKVTQLKGVRHD